MLRESFCVFAKIRGNLQSKHILHFIRKGDLAVDLKVKEPLKIAVACENGKVVRHLGETKQLALFDTGNGKILGQEVIKVKQDEPSLLGGAFTENNVDVLICDEVTGEEAKELRHAGILTYAGNRGSGEELVDRLLQQELFYDPGAHLSEENPVCERCVDHRDYRMEIAAEIGRISGHNRFHRGHNRVEGETTGHNQYVNNKNVR